MNAAARTSKKRTSDPFAFDRTDLIGVRILAGLAAVVVPLGALVVPAVTWLSGDALSRTVSWLDTAPPKIAALSEGATGEYVDSGTITLQDASPSTWLWHLLPGIVVTAATVVMCLLVWRLVGLMLSPTPFGGRTVTLLRRMAAVLTLAPVLTFVANSAADSAVRSAGMDGHGGFWMDIAPGATLTYAGFIAAGMLIAAISQAFLRGGQLQDDVDGLV
ncbi:MAG: hypothetical protein V9G04_06305 [Nocardioides sp.]|jgi:hypothetical protein